MLCQRDVVELLLEKGADINLKGESGETALDHAIRPWPENWELGLTAIGVNNSHPEDVDRIRRDQPEIAKLLREAAGESGSRGHH